MLIFGYVGRPPHIKCPTRKKKVFLSILLVLPSIDFVDREGKKAEFLHYYCSLTGSFPFLVRSLWFLWLFIIMPLSPRIWSFWITQNIVFSSSFHHFSPLFLIVRFVIFFFVSSLLLFLSRKRAEGTRHGIGQYKTSEAYINIITIRKIIKPKWNRKKTRQKNKINQKNQKPLMS